MDSPGPPPRRSDVEGCSLIGGRALGLIVIRRRAGPWAGKGGGSFGWVFWESEVNPRQHAGLGRQLDDGRRPARSGRPAHRRESVRRPEAWAAASGGASLGRIRLRPGAIADSLSGGTLATDESTTRLPACFFASEAGSGVAGRLGGASSGMQTIHSVNSKHEADWLAPGHQGLAAHRPRERQRGQHKPLAAASRQR